MALRSILCIERASARVQLKEHLVAGERIRNTAEHFRDVDTEEGWRQFLECEDEAAIWNDRSSKLLEKLFTGETEAAEYENLPNHPEAPDHDANSQPQLALLPLRLRKMRSVLENLDLYPEPTRPVQCSEDTRSPTKSTGRSVFVVYGHDDAMKQAVARCLEQLKLRPILLDEEADSGRTIIEKFEAHSADAIFAVVLLSPDDRCGDKQRARQNVIFEMGYFVGRLGRSRVGALYKPHLELPSDLHGMLHTEFDSKGAWRHQLAREMKAAGIDVSVDHLAG